MTEAVFSVPCEEPKGIVVRSVYPFVFSIETIKKLYKKAAKFPVLFGRPLEGPADFERHFITYDSAGIPSPTGLIWIVDDYIGMFYLTDIYESEATAHFSFFDKRIHGRKPLVQAMLRHVFELVPSLNRLNVEIPLYAGEKVIPFVRLCGFSVEGRKRKAAYYRGQWFDKLSLGILRSEVMDGNEY